MKKVMCGDLRKKKTRSIFLKVKVEILLKEKVSYRINQSETLLYILRKEFSRDFSDKFQSIDDTSLKRWILWFAQYAETFNLELNMTKNKI